MRLKTTFIGVWKMFVFEIILATYKVHMLNTEGFSYGEIYIHLERNHSLDVNVSIFPNLKTTLSSNMLVLCSQ